MKNKKFNMENEILSQIVVNFKNTNALMDATAPIQVNLEFGENKVSSKDYFKSLKRKLGNKTILDFIKENDIVNKPKKREFYETAPLTLGDNLFVLELIHMRDVMVEYFGFENTAENIAEFYGILLRMLDLKKVYEFVTKEKYHETKAITFFMKKVGLFLQLLLDNETKMKMYVDMGETVSFHELEDVFKNEKVLNMMDEVYHNEENDLISIIENNFEGKKLEIAFNVMIPFFGLYVILKEVEELTDYKFKITEDGILQLMKTLAEITKSPILVFFK